MIILALVGQIDVHLEITSVIPHRSSPQRMEEGGKGEYMSKRKTELWILVFLLSILTHLFFKVTIRIYIFIEVLLSIVT